MSESCTPVEPYAEGSTIAVRVRNLRCVFNRSESLTDTDNVEGGHIEIEGLDVFEGDFLSIVGSNGIGKSTILRVLAGEGRLLDMRIEFDHLSWFESEHYPEVAQRVAYLRQRAHLIPWYSVKENLEFAAQLRRGAKPPSWRLEELIDLLDLHEVIGKFPSQLSGGNYQRAALAQVLAVSPDLLLLDEPASAADPSRRAAVVNALHRLRSSRAEADHLPLTVVQVTHDVENAALASDALLVMTWGREGTRAIRHRFSIASSDSQASRIERSRLRQAIDLLCSPSGGSAITSAEVRTREAAARDGDIVLVVALEAQRELDMVRDADFFGVVSENLAKGVSYHYFFPDHHEVETLRSKLVAKARLPNALVIHSDLGYELFRSVGDIVILLRDDRPFDGWWFPLPYDYSVIQALSPAELEWSCERILPLLKAHGDG